MRSGKAAALALVILGFAARTGSPATLDDRLSRLPLGFEENAGQLDPRADFVAHGEGYAVFLADGDAVLALHRAGRVAPAVVALRLVGASCSAAARGLDALPGRVNVYRGDDPQRWRRDVATFRRVAYDAVYPGIDLVYYGNGGQLEHDFVVAPGADPRAIAFRIDGANTVELNDAGELVVAIADGVIRFAPPLTYQDRDGSRIPVASRFVLRDDGHVAFALGVYDEARPLVIDPVLAYSTYLGGNNDRVNYAADSAHAVATDAAGNIYVAGMTETDDFPTIAAAQPERGATTGTPNAFVTKLSPDGTSMLYSTYLGGSFARAFAIAVDAMGAAFVTGEASSGFPTVRALFPSTRAFGAFVTKLGATGAIEFSTYLGARTAAMGRGIAVDPDGAAWVVGQTLFNTPGADANFPVTADAFDAVPSGGREAFLARIAGDGSALLYSTLFGGSGDDTAAAVAVDRAGRPVVAGYTTSTDLPVAGAIQAASAGGAVENDEIGGNVSQGADAFIARFARDGRTLDYATYLGGTGGEVAQGVAVDAAGRVTVVGRTSSIDFPTVHPVQAAKGTGSDAFVARLSADGAALDFSTYLGGTGDDVAYAVAVDAAGDIAVGGSTEAMDFPVVDGLPTPAALESGFVARYGANGTLDWATRLGGSFQDAVHGIALDTAEAVVAVGFAQSDDFPTRNALQPLQRSSAGNAFVAKLVGRGAGGIDAVYPSEGGDEGRVSVRAYGSGFAPGASHRLRRPGYADLVALDVSVADDGHEVLGLFDLRNQARGAWSAAVRNPDGTEVLLADAFTVVAGAGPRVTVQVMGPSLVAVMRPNVFSVIVRNLGDADVVLLPLWIAIPPEAAAWQLLGELRVPGAAPIDARMVDVSTMHHGEHVLPLVLYRLAAGASAVVRLTLTVEHEGPLRLRAWTTPSLVDGLGVSATPSAVRNTASGGSSGGCAKAVSQMAVDALGAIPGLSCLPYAAGMAILSNSIATSGLFVDGTNGETSATTTVAQMVLTDISRVASCSGIVPVAAVVNGINLGIDAVEVYNACHEQEQNGDDLGIDGVRSKDPNDMVGPHGVGAARYIRGDDPFTYGILFENTPDATAPAQEVVIVDQLDGALLDLDSFTLGPMSFGDVVLTPPPGLSAWSTRVDLRATRGILVDVAAGLDRQTGTVTWRFGSIDPDTNALPADPRRGFLPPNVAPPAGDGSVLFSVHIRAGLPTGTAVSGRAAIVFDVNDPIETPEWTNTIDVTAPASTVAPLPDAVPPTFNVAWNGSDVGAGIARYTVSVSRDGRPFEPWLVDTTATGAAFDGVVGSTYAFTVAARDGVGNVEPAHGAADVAVRVTAAATGACDLAVIPLESLAGVACALGRLHAAVGASASCKRCRLHCRAAALLDRADALLARAAGTTGRVCGRRLGALRRVGRRAARRVTRLASSTCAPSADAAILENLARALRERIDATVAGRHCGD
jgi:hypothetical protein